MKKILFTVAALLLSGSAAAHTGSHEVAGLASGISHPLSGLDHLAAMLAVGLWAGLAGRKAWAPIAAFLGAMGLGAALGMAGIALPQIETGIAASLLVLGLLLAGLVRTSPAAGSALVAAFALFHGQAHGAEMPAAAAPLLYALGFLGTTGLLHLTGLGLSRAVQTLKSQWLLRAAGVLTGGLGLGLLVGA